MNPTKINTTIFFEEALTAHRKFVLSMMADAVRESRAAADDGWSLTEEGTAGLLRLMELWCIIHSPAQPIVLEGNGTQLLADVIPQIYAHLTMHLLEGVEGLAIYVELQHMMAQLVQHAWYE